MGRRARVLVVAGHDPSGAGVDADRAACSDLDVTVEIVVTARTDQSASSVRSIGAVDPERWFDEALAHANEPIDAIKFGLLPGARHVECATRLVTAVRARFGERLHVVVDPVLAASSGSRFLDATAVEALRGELFGAGVIATPNLDEAAELSSLPRQRLIDALSARAEAAEILLGLGLAAAIVKGGHGREDPVVDLLAVAGEPVLLIAHPRRSGAKVRGSGCRFASHLAARLALGDPLEVAARHAAAHVEALLTGGRF
ncbi:MAG: bifunctional hydroxymethylpyrimidine kinase/phosphomethylpyrimidine kinase [Planctomycetota bacterium]|nr:bifunctional hydroxymethylpyrimidine kinase/phosphomethylpyrimidine kinase [Planctomycetota bacterium]